MKILNDAVHNFFLKDAVHDNYRYHISASKYLPLTQYLPHNICRYENRYYEIRSSLRRRYCEADTEWETDIVRQIHQSNDYAPGRIQLFMNYAPSRGQVFILPSLILQGNLNSHC